VGDKEFHVIFPFVELRDEHPTKIIKPLNLAQDKTTKILEHGNKWEFRIRKLQERAAFPESVLFAVDGPEGQGARANAYDEAVGMLRETGVTVKPYNDRLEILEFASA
jgi:hypothetical protein